MITPRAIKIISVAIACFLLPACATKKYVKQEVATTRTEMTTRIDQQASEQAKLNSQLQELSQLNKQNSGRIDKVQSDLGTAVSTLEPKIEDAKRTGTEAHGVADTALSSSKENAAAFASRNNYQVLDTKDVLFKSGSSTLDDAAKGTLSEISKTLAENKNLIVELLGYTDSVGDTGFNLRLSERRVDAVIRHLVEANKTELPRIHSLGLGESDPADSNSTRAGRAKNRRVTIIVLGLK